MLLVLGLPALFAPIVTAGYDTRRGYLAMLAATGLFIVLCHMGPIGWPQGLLLLAGFAAMLADALREAWRGRLAGRRAAVMPVAAPANAARLSAEDVPAADRTGAPEADIDPIALEELEPGVARGRTVGLMLIGLVGLPLGAQILVWGATGIALAAGISEAVIGLTLIAIGTSAPELATTIIAALRGRADVVLGNVIGSNLFNLLAIVGTAALFGALPIPPDMLSRDLWVMAGTALLLASFVFFGRRINRHLGFALTGLYVGYLFLLISEAGG